MVDTDKMNRGTGKNVKKAEVLDYSIYWQLVSIESIRKTVKWYKKRVLYLTDIAMLNTYNLWLSKTSLSLFNKAIEQMIKKIQCSSGSNSSQQLNHSL